MAPAAVASATPASGPCEIPYPMPSAPAPAPLALPVVPAEIREERRERYELVKRDSHEGYNGASVAAFGVYGTGTLTSRAGGLQTDSTYHGTSYGLSAGYDRLLTLDDIGALTLGVGLGYSEGRDRGEISGQNYSDSMRNLLAGVSLNQVIFLGRGTALRVGASFGAGLEQETYRDNNASGAYDGAHQSGLWAIGCGVGLSHQVGGSTLAFVGYDFYKVGDTTHRFTSDTGVTLELNRRQRSAQQISVGLTFLW